MKTTHQLSILAAAVLVVPAGRAAERMIPFRLSPDDPVTLRKARYDYSSYAKIPDTPTGRTYRFVLRSIPYTRKNSYWGNYAGSGCFGGRPVDAMDDIFRRHDIAYAEAQSLQTMKWADEACVEALRRLDTSRMSTEAIAFRDRSVAFFSNHRLALVGKPVSSFFRRGEAEDCPLSTRAEIRELFGLDKIPSTPAENAANKTSPSLRVSLAAKQKAIPNPKTRAARNRHLPGRRHNPAPVLLAAAPRTR